MTGYSLPCATGGEGGEVKVGYWGRGEVKVGYWGARGEGNYIGYKPPTPPDVERIKGRTINANNNALAYPISALVLLFTKKEFKQYIEQIDNINDKYKKMSRSYRGGIKGGGGDDGIG